MVDVDVFLLVCGFLTAYDGRTFPALLRGGVVRIHVERVLLLLRCRRETYGKVVYHVLQMLHVVHSLLRTHGMLMVMSRMMSVRSRPRM